jgi:hypothetical protein
MDVDVTVQHDDASMVELGALKLVVFGRLKNSTRKDSTDSPGRAKFLKTEASYCRNASDCNVKAFTCPYVNCGATT